MAGSMSLGAALWSQSSDWPSYLEAARRVDRLGYDHLWTWDHIYPIFGALHRPVFEGYTSLSAFAMVTEHARLGLFVGANTFRNPGLAAKSIATIDQISGGRAIMGIGGAWFEAEHRAYGIDFGTGFGQRLDWLAEAAPAVRALLDGDEVTSEPGGHYAFDGLRLVPRPIQPRVPVLVGGSGEKKTLPIVARWADMWNAFGTPEGLARKNEILASYCDAIGRDPETIQRSVACQITIRSTEAEARDALADSMVRNGISLAEIADDEAFWIGNAEAIAEKILAYQGTGFDDFIVQFPAPYDVETLETLIGVVKPMVEAAR